MLIWPVIKTEAPPWPGQMVTPRFRYRRDVIPHPCLPSPLLSCWRRPTTTTIRSSSQPTTFTVPRTGCSRRWPPARASSTRRPVPSATSQIPLPQSSSIPRILTCLPDAKREEEEKKGESVAEKFPRKRGRRDATRGEVRAINTSGQIAEQAGPAWPGLAGMSDGPGGKYSISAVLETRKE